LNSFTIFEVLISFDREFHTFGPLKEKLDLYNSIFLDEHDLKKQSSELFRECGIVPITKKILYHKALLMYKSKNELAPEYLSNLIVSANNNYPKLNNSNLSGEEYMYYKTEFSFCDSSIS
jgi:hypothetical protein